jgi:urease beta subunit
MFKLLHSYMFIRAIMKLNRRKTVLGIGALATGSGAVFTSAGFAGSAEASSDFRVVTEGSLVVEPNNNVSDGGNQIADNKSDPSGYLFKNSSSLSGNTSVSEVKDGGEAAVNNQTDGGLELAIAVADDTDKDFNILQVTNNGDTTESVGATISGYGSDVGSSITQSDVNNAFEFDIEDSSDNYQDVGSGTFVSVGPGDTRGLRIDVDMSQIPDDDLANASASGGDVFDSSTAADTVDLVDTIKIGVQ